MISVGTWLCLIDSQVYITISKHCRKNTLLLKSVDGHVTAVVNQMSSFQWREKNMKLKEGGNIKREKLKRLKS